MLFGIIMLVLVAAVAFYHYIQGFFSAVVSAALVIMAAVLAISFHEPIAESVLADHVPAYAHAIVLVVFFSLTYLIMRLLTDRLVPGNVRFHVIVDKVGAGAAGAVAGIFAAGVLAVAAQTMPFGPSIAGYSRFPFADRGEITIENLPRKYYDTHFLITRELERDDLDTAQASAMFPIPVDGAVLGLTSYLSNGGSLAGERPFASVHPDYATELFAHRMSQPYQGGDVLYSKSNTGVSVSHVYTSRWVMNSPQDLELKPIRADRTVAVPQTEGMTPVVVRASLLGGKGSLLTMGSFRLVVAGKDHYPIGSYQRGEQLALTRPDDPVLIDGSKSVDFVFLVDTSLLAGKEGSGKALPRGSFLQAKRAARADLSGKEISENPPGGGDNIGVTPKTPPRPY